ncbi:MAG: phage tail protein I [Candidatus Gastranaerophilales bacterium]|nr:phage tail protein I [Candidatus Gastranaerophilales bacterium]
MNDSRCLAPINDINLTVFDKICEERLKNIDLDCILVSIIDNVPSDALPHLAEQYHITGNEGWLQALSETEKRNLIKSAIKMHRYKGTKYALEEIFNTLNIVGNVEEWFEYGGEPYYFKVILQITNRSINEETETKLRALINEYKNERSWLEELQFYLTSKSSLKLSAVCTSEETISVNCKEACCE